MHDLGGVSYPCEYEPTQEEKNWALGAHLSPVIASFIVLAPLGPFIVYLVQKDKSRFAAYAALQALAFSIGAIVVGLVIGLIASILMCVCGLGVILFPLLIILPIAYLVYAIVAMIHASEGRHYEYPLTSQFVQGMLDK